MMIVQSTPVFRNINTKWSVFPSHIPIDGENLCVGDYVITAEVMATVVVLAAVVLY
jgi:hypothetical protein